VKEAGIGRHIKYAYVKNGQKKSKSHIAPGAVQKKTNSILKEKIHEGVVNGKREGRPGSGGEP